MRPLDTFRRWFTNGTPPSEVDRTTPVPHETGGNGKAVTRQVGKPAASPAPAPEAPWLAQLDAASIPRSLVYPTTTLGRVLDQTADRFGDATAVVYGATRWTYRELLAQVNRTAGGLASLGVRRGDRVLLTLPNCPEMLTTFLAVQKLGAVVVNVGPLMGADDLSAVMSMTAPRVAVGLDLQAPVLERAGQGSAVEHWVWVSLQAYQPVLKRLGYQYKLWTGRNGHGNKAQHVELDELLAQAPPRPPTVEPDPNKVAVLQATGGTTGTLKLAQLSHRSLLANAMQVSAWMKISPGQERFLAVLPMFHVFGLTTCMVAPLFNASSMILMTRFNAVDMLATCRAERPTVIPIVPAICAALCDELERQEKKDGKKPPLLDSIRLCISGAAPLPVPAIERFRKYTGAPLIEGYGLTEASPVTHVNLESRPRAGSIGLPMPDTKVRIVQVDGNPYHPKDVAPGEPGEMLISGPQVMLGYFSNPEQTRSALLTAEDGNVWLRTGDIVRMDEEGFFYVLDRKKDMIIRGGLKVFPAKVENVLRRHSRVTDVAVVGRADEVKTETVVAVVVVTEPPPPSDKSAAAVAAAAEQDRKQLIGELRSLCREHLAPYEVPQEFEFVKELPRSPLGKLLKRELRKKPTAAEPPVAADNGKASGNGKPAADRLKPAGADGQRNNNGNGSAGAAAHHPETQEEGV